MNLPKRYESGFTIVEIIAVLLLLSIIAATVMGRSISTKNIDLTAQMDRVRNHFRYAHSMAMKHGDAVWGFKCDGDAPREYWVFRLDPPIVRQHHRTESAGQPGQASGRDGFKGELEQQECNHGQIRHLFWSVRPVPI